MRPYWPSGLRLVFLGIWSGLRAIENVVGAEMDEPRALCSRGVLRHHARRSCIDESPLPLAVRLAAVRIRQTRTINEHVVGLPTRAVRLGPASPPHPAPGAPEPDVTAFRPNTRKPRAQPPVAPKDQHLHDLMPLL